MSNIYRELLEITAQGRFAVLETTITGQRGSIASDMERRIVKLEPPAGQCVRAEVRSVGERTLLREPVFPRERMIVLGGGHIAVPVCEFAAKVGFSVTVCDDRPEFANRERFPLAEQVICDGFQNALRSLHVTPMDYVVVITRGHRYDADCLRVLLAGTMPAYLGLIGSRRRVRGLLNMLQEEGYPQQAMEAICTPIGLPIGAITPGQALVLYDGDVVLGGGTIESYS